MDGSYERFQVPSSISLAERAGGPVNKPRERLQFPRSMSLAGRADGRLDGSCGHFQLLSNSMAGRADGWTGSMSVPNYRFPAAWLGGRTDDTETGNREPGALCS